MVEICEDVPSYGVLDIVVGSIDCYVHLYGVKNKVEEGEDEEWWPVETGEVR